MIHFVESLDRYTLPYIMHLSNATDNGRLLLQQLNTRPINGGGGVKKLPPS